MTIDEMISKSYDLGLNLEAGDFYVIDGVLTLDGMPADQWLEAMMMD